MDTLYILELECFKFYIGRSADPDERIGAHFAGRGLEWTRIFKPNRVRVRRPLIDLHDEDNTTLDYIAQYGIENVRGGSWCQRVLMPAQIDAIQRQVRHLQNLCLNCGLKGHQANVCDFNRSPSVGAGADIMNIDGNSANKTRGYYNRSTRRDVAYRSGGRISDNCYNCGRAGHWAEECIEDDNVDSYSDSSEEDEGCFRCGRGGHWASACFARTHVDGAPL
ncbi:hypothetical protein BC832DRAFT_893 [Gaertneriomyces semiglobifer]|nr:hypothetical protein BC832DRAFT_893 [Gaertneriomyces semiglobifer]